MSAFLNFAEITHHRQSKVVIISIMLLLLVALAALPGNRPAVAVNNSVYYVDCNGSDSNNGLSPSSAWQLLNRANQAALVPGDSLLFKRGCTWEGTLEASWQGTADQPILIGAYGSGNLPVIINGPKDLNSGSYSNVDITGSHLIIEYIKTTIVNPPVDPACGNNPIGFFIGFNFRNLAGVPNGGSYNVLRYSVATHHTAGVHLHTTTHDNRIVHNTLTNNNVMETLTPVSVSAVDDIGAWGILLKGNNNVIAYNYLSNNNAKCTFDTSPQGNSIELYQAQNNFIHHNTAVDDRVFSELGGSQAIHSSDNTYAYNLVISSIKDAHFITTRGNQDQFGPVYRTHLTGNTVYFSGPDSEGIVCGAGCNGNILSATNNIIVAERKVAYADGQFIENHNIYWSSNGKPVIQFIGFSMDSTSMIADPGFVNPTNQDFHLTSSSLAIDHGSLLCGYVDLDGVLVPQGNDTDIGAYEFPGLPAQATTAPKNPCGIARVYLPNLFK